MSLKCNICEQPSVLPVCRDCDQKLNVKATKPFHPSTAPVGTYFEAWNPRNDFVGIFYKFSKIRILVVDSNQIDEGNELMADKWSSDAQFSELPDPAKELRESATYVPEHDFGTYNTGTTPWFNTNSISEAVIKERILRGTTAFAEAKAEAKTVCQCDFVSQILPYGCVCGGK